jgi:hypothetical protein
MGVAATLGEFSPKGRKVRDHHFVRADLSRFAWANLGAMRGLGVIQWHPSLAFGDVRETDSEG